MAQGGGGDPVVCVDTLKQVGELMVYGDRQAGTAGNDRFFE